MKFHIVYSGDFLNEDGVPAYTRAGLDELAQTPWVTYRYLTDQSPRRGDAAYWDRFYSLEMTSDHLADVDGLVVLRPRVGRAVLAQVADRLVVIGRCGAGYDKVDLAACTEHDIALFNAPLALKHSTASTALLFILALAKKLQEHERITRNGRWDLQAAALGNEIEGRTLGIIGLGHSGRELARLIAPFGMRLLAYSPHAEPAQAAALGVQLTSLETLLCESDFVSLHARLSDQSRGLIGAPQLALMKPAACFINVARGEIVDQRALADALRTKQIAGAALDVFETEPLPLDDPLLALENVILTPHWSASTADVWQATGRAMAAGMLQAARGEQPDNVVNREVLDRPGFRKKLGRFAPNRNVPSNPVIMPGRQERFDE